jgi:hypothetical protein
VRISCTFDLFIHCLQVLLARVLGGTLGGVLAADFERAGENACLNHMVHDLLSGDTAFDEAAFVHFIENLCSSG